MPSFVLDRLDDIVRAAQPAGRRRAYAEYVNAPTGSRLIIVKKVATSIDADRRHVEHLGDVRPWPRGSASPSAGAAPGSSSANGAASARADISRCCFSRFRQILAGEFEWLGMFKVIFDLLSSVDLPENDVHGAEDGDGIRQHVALADMKSIDCRCAKPGARILQR